MKEIENYSTYLLVRILVRVISKMDKNTNGHLNV